MMDAVTAPLTTPTTSTAPTARRDLLDAVARLVLAQYPSGPRVLAVDAAAVTPELIAFADDLAAALAEAGQTVRRADAGAPDGDDALLAEVLDPFRASGDDAVLVLAGAELQRATLRGRFASTVWVDLPGEAGAAAPIADAYRAGRPREAASIVVDLRLPDAPKQLFLDYCVL
jgi:hypothetical protein